jgi:CRP/FNR family transcriptional regulator
MNTISLEKAPPTPEWLRMPIQQDASLSFLSASGKFNEISALAQCRNYRAGDMIQRCGDQQVTVGFIEKGYAKVSLSAADGRHQILNILASKDFFGTLGIKYTAFDICALVDMKCCIFERKAFEQLVEKHPSLTRHMMHYAMVELEEMRKWAFLLGRKTALERVATFVLQMYHSVGCDESTEFELSLSRFEIADLLGLTCETVSRQMTKLRKSGVIDTNGIKHITVLNEIALKKLHGSDKTNWELKNAN